MTFRSFYIALMTPVLFLSACTPPTLWQEKQQQQSFTQALDHYLSENDRTHLDTLAFSEPPTLWSQRARQLVTRLDNLEQQRQDVTTALNKAQNDYTVQLQLLQQENRDLQETMDQLKQLFIDMELRE